MVGAPSWLPKQGYFGLMFLKHYLKLSDEKLLERFNTDWAMQLFCGTLLADNERIINNSFILKARSYLCKHVNFEEFQRKIIENWRDEIPDKTILLQDATCYEVYIRFPTDIKLLWESCQWIWEKMIPEICQRNKLKVPRSNLKNNIKNTLFIVNCAKNLIKKRKQESVKVYIFCQKASLNYKKF